MRRTKSVEDLHERSIVLNDERSWPHDSERRVLVKLLPDNDIITIAAIHLDKDEDVTLKPYCIRIDLEIYDTRYTWFDDKDKSERVEVEMIRDTIRDSIKKIP